MNMKSYTDLEQSEKLAEKILPPDSADMEYMFLKTDNSMVAEVPFIKDGYEEPDCPYNMVSCWSLTALLNVLPVGTRLLKSATDATYHCDCPKWNIDKWFDNPIDAAFELIVKLHEQNIL